MLPKEINGNTTLMDLDVTPRALVLACVTGVGRVAASDGAVVPSDTALATITPTPIARANHCRPVAQRCCCTPPTPLAFPAVTAPEDSDGATGVADRHRGWIRDQTVKQPRSSDEDWMSGEYRNDPGVRQRWR